MDQPIQLKTFGNPKSVSNVATNATAESIDNETAIPVSDDSEPNTTSADLKIADGVQAGLAVPSSGCNIIPVPLETAVDLSSSPCPLKLTTFGSSISTTPAVDSDAPSDANGNVQQSKPHEKPNNVIAISTQTPSPNTTAEDTASLSKDSETGLATDHHSPKPGYLGADEKSASPRSRGTEIQLRLEPYEAQAPVVLSEETSGECNSLVAGEMKIRLFGAELDPVVRPSERKANTTRFVVLMMMAAATVTLIAVTVAVVVFVTYANMAKILGYGNTASSLPKDNVTIEGEVRLIGLELSALHQDRLSLEEEFIQWMDMTFTSSKHRGLYNTTRVVDIRNGSVIVDFLVLLKPIEKLRASVGVSRVTLGPYEVAFAFLKTSLPDLNVTGDMAGTLRKVNVLKLHLFIGSDMAIELSTGNPGLDPTTEAQWFSATSQPPTNQASTTQAFSSHTSTTHNPPSTTLRSTKETSTDLASTTQTSIIQTTASSMSQVPISQPSTTQSPTTSLTLTNQHITDGATSITSTSTSQPGTSKPSTSMAPAINPSTEVPTTIPDVSGWTGGTVMYQTAREAFTPSMSSVSAASSRSTTDVRRRRSTQSEVHTPTTRTTRNAPSTNRRSTKQTSKTVTPSSHASTSYSAASHASTTQNPPSSTRRSTEQKFTTLTPSHTSTTHRSTSRVSTDQTSTTQAFSSHTSTTHNPPSTTLRSTKETSTDLASTTQTSIIQTTASSMSQVPISQPSTTQSPTTSLTLTNQHITDGATSITSTSTSQPGTSKPSTSMAPAINPSTEAPTTIPDVSGWTGGTVMYQTAREAFTPSMSSVSAASSRSTTDVRRRRSTQSEVHTPTTRTTRNAPSTNRRSTKQTSKTVTPSSHASTSYSAASHASTTQNPPSSTRRSTEQKFTTLTPSHTSTTHRSTSRVSTDQTSTTQTFTSHASTTQNPPSTTRRSTEQKFTTLTPSIHASTTNSSTSHVSTTQNLPSATRRTTEQKSTTLTPSHTSTTHRSTSRVSTYQTSTTLKTRQASTTQASTTQTFKSHASTTQNLPSTTRRTTEQKPTTMTQSIHASTTHSSTNHASTTQNLPSTSGRATEQKSTSFTPSHTSTTHRSTSRVSTDQTSTTHSQTSHASRTQNLSSTSGRATEQKSTSFTPSHTSTTHRSTSRVSTDQISTTQTSTTLKTRQASTTQTFTSHASTTHNPPSTSHPGTSKPSTSMAPPINLSTEAPTTIPNVSVWTGGTVMYQTPSASSSQSTINIRQRSTRSQVHASTTHITRTSSTHLSMPLTTKTNDDIIVGCFPNPLPSCVSGGWSQNTTWTPNRFNLGNNTNQIRHMYTTLTQDMTLHNSGELHQVLCTLLAPSCEDVMIGPTLPCRSACVDVVRLLNNTLEARTLEALCNKSLPESESENICFKTSGPNDGSNGVSPCSSSYCLNGGSCFDIKGVAYCRCPRAFGGDRCQIDPCTPNPCYNGSTCHGIADFITSYACGCQMGYHGKHCELRDGDPIPPPDSNEPTPSPIGVPTCRDILTYNDSISDTRVPDWRVVAPLASCGRDARLIFCAMAFPEFHLLSWSFQRSAPCRDVCERAFEECDILFNALDRSFPEICARLGTSQTDVDNFCTAY